MLVDMKEQNPLLLRGKKFSEVHTDYHDDMNKSVFEDWFKDSYSEG